MGNSEVKIQCNNSSCQASNYSDVKFCVQCRTPLTKRYLRITSETKNNYPIGTIFGDRYLVTNQSVVLDTKPAIVPEIPEELPEQIKTYLKLSPYKLNLPQVFGRLEENTAKNPWGTWLLEYSYIPQTELGELKYPELFPSLSQQWMQASGIRQINWLWQIAKLWYPLQRQNAVSTLLNPELLRTNGAIIHILELQPDESNPPFASLGELWNTYVPNSSNLVKEFLKEVCQSLESKEISNPEQLLAILDGGLYYCGQGQKRTYNIFTASDTGPSRDHNEDACYPPENKTISASGGFKSLAIVCDGVGGQEAGEIASQMAIETMVEHIKAISFNNSTNWNPNDNIAQLKRVSNQVNDLISQRNDEENRQERKRMGTTIVSTLAQAHELYITHIGDSRLYWITANGCYQLTVDDDLASREVRLGYAVYRDAVQYPNGGALFQALGMSPSDKLYPNVQRLTVEDDCLFLLCSDGLSDNERVDQYWQSELLPLLEGKADLARVAKKLIEIANETNGHDNATVALVHCRVQPEKNLDNLTIPWLKIKETLNHVQTIKTAQAVAPSPLPPKTTTTTQIDKTSPVELSSNKKWLFPLLILLGVGALVSLLLSFFQQQPQIAPSLNPTPANPVPTNKPTSPQAQPSSPPTSSPIPDQPTQQPTQLELTRGSIFKLKQSIILKSLPSAATQNNQNLQTLPPSLEAGSIVRVLQTESQISQVKLQLCPHQISSSNSIVQGWVDLKTFMAAIADQKTTKEEEQNCPSLGNAN